MGIPAPRARALVAWTALACAATAVALVVGGGSAGADQPAPGPQADAERGGELYQRWCAVCHATDGAGTGAGPPIDEVPIALMDLTMRTGYMPLTDERHGVREREFTDAEREAALAYMVERFDLDGQVEEPAAGDVVRGQDLYTLHCAQCHGATGEGGVSGRDATVPATRGVEPMLIAQAVRTGPFQMPPFSDEQIDDEALDAIVAFLADQPPQSPLGLADLTRPAAFGWALLLGGLVLAACRWISTHPLHGPTPPDPVDDPGLTPAGDPEHKGPTP